jgi:membrane-associated phospholipid phosphatase
VAHRTADRTTLACLASLIAFAPAVVPSGALAGGDGAGQGAGLRYDLRIDGAVTVVGLAFWGGSELLKGQMAPSGCRWCASNGLDRPVRSALAWDDRQMAIVASNVGAYGVVPLASLGVMALGAHREDRAGEMGGNALVVAEAVALAGTLGQIVKLAAGRERPFVHALPPGEKPLTDIPSDNNLSFYSGHSSFAFSLAVASGTVSSMRGYRWAKAVWAGGLMAAAAVAYLRIAADKHYLTDVVVGAAVGSAIGFTVPYLFHSPRVPVALVPLRDGASLSLSTSW